MVKVIDDLYTYHKENSADLFQKAEEVIPGGVTANIKHFAPYPIFMKKGEGSRLTDVDNKEYIDYSLCYGALITGHGHPKVLERSEERRVGKECRCRGAPCH